MINLTYKESNNQMKLFLLIGLSLYRAKGPAKLILIFFTACATTPFVETITKYIVPKELDNWVILMILLILDVVSGVTKHSRIFEPKVKNTLNKDEFFLKLIKKVFIGSVWLILINVIVNQDPSNDYFNKFGIAAIISWIGWSIASNLYVISGSEFPPEWIMTYFRNKNNKKDIDE